MERDFQHIGPTVVAIFMNAIDQACVQKLLEPLPEGQYWDPNDNHQHEERQLQLTF